MAKALDLDSKSKFDLMGDWCCGFDKTKMKFVSNVKNLKQSSNTKNYIVFDTGLEKNTAFTFEVKTNRLIPVKSTYEIVSTTTTREKLIEIKTESDKQKLKKTGSVELVEDEKVKTVLTGEYDVDNFDFMNKPLKDLVSEDVTMIRLSIPNITSFTPIYFNEKKKIIFLIRSVNFMIKKKRLSSK